MIDKLQGQFIKYINKEDLSLNQKVKFLDELYWSDLKALSDSPDTNMDSLFQHLKSEELSIEEIAKVLNLYNNLDGAYTQEFAEIIANLYSKDRIKFFRALNLNKDEAINIVYVFRIIKVFEDKNIELQEVKNSNKLTEEEIDTANTFFNMYETICNT